MSKTFTDILRILGNSKYSTHRDLSIINKITEEEDGLSISCDGCGFFLPKKRLENSNIIPKAQDNITIYEFQGSRIRGIDINGENLFFLTDEEIDREHEEWKRNYEKEKQETFEREKEQYDEQYESLPIEFKQRIDKFRKDNPKFRVDYEAYELFCCTEAVKIADTLKTPEKVKEFSESDDRWSMVPDLGRGHSGNTMGMATQLAYWYLNEPGVITRIDGALSPLVGSREYEEKNKRVKLNK